MPPIAENFQEVQSPWSLWSHRSAFGRFGITFVVAAICVGLAGLPKWPETPPDRASQPPEIILRQDLIRGLQQMDGVEAVAVSVLPAQEALGEPARLVIMGEGLKLSARHIKNRAARLAPSVAPAEIMVVDTLGQNLLPNPNPLHSAPPPEPSLVLHQQMTEEPCHKTLQARVGSGNYELAFQLNPAGRPSSIQLRIANPAEHPLVRPSLIGILRLSEHDAKNFTIERMPYGHQRLSPEEAEKMRAELVRPEPPYPTQSLILLAPGLFLLMLYYADLRSRHRTCR